MSITILTFWGHLSACVADFFFYCCRRHYVSLTIDTLLPFQARGQTAQRVHLATRLLSNTVAEALQHVLLEEEVARAVRTIDHWFDVMNSRRTVDAKLERCAYGHSDAAKAAQDAALANMEAMTVSMRKADGDQDSALLPFQRGILRSTSSLRGLYQDLRSSRPDLRYIMTSRLNQDCLENTFSQLRSMCGPSTHPDAVEVRQRLRILLIAPSSVSAISCPERTVAVEQSADFLSTGITPTAPTDTTALSDTGLDDPDVQVRYLSSLKELKI